MVKKLIILTCLLALVILAFVVIGWRQIQQKRDWPHRDYARVLAVEFEDNTVETGSLLHTLPPDPAHIERCITKRAVLHEAQIKSLISATQGLHWPVDASTCYSPRHAFIFYAENGEMAGLIEVCFQCRGLKRYPAVEDEWMYDLDSLRDLSQSLGMSGHD